MDPRQKVKDLIELALDSTNDNDKERIAAAMKALRMIQKYDLLASPLDGLLEGGNETVAAVGDILGRLSDPSLMNSVKKIAGHFSDARGRRRRR